MTVSQEVLRDARAALVLLNAAADRAGQAFDDEEYDGLAGALELLGAWIYKVES